MALSDVDLQLRLLEEVGEVERQRPNSWVHFPARAVGRVALMHNMPLPFRTHWNGHKDEWCFGRARGCDRCARGQGFKGHYAFAVYDLARKQHGGFDFNDRGIRQILEADLPAETRTGCTFTIRKEGGVVNGAFVIETSGLFIRVFDFGEPCDVVSLVCKTYGVTRDAFDEHFLAGLGFPAVVPAPLVEGALQRTR